jgi:hypothetical protein
MQTAFSVAMAQRCCWRLHMDIRLLTVLGFCAEHNSEARVEVDHPTVVYIGEANARGARLLS